MTSNSEPPPAGAFHPVAHSLQAVINLSNEIERELVRLLGINLTDYRALTMLMSGGPTVISDLAERIGASAATTTAILNRLESAGYVQRERTDADRRRVHVSVAPGVVAEIVRLMGPLLHTVNDQITSCSAEQQGAIEGFFGHVTAALEGHLAELSAQDPPDGERPVDSRSQQ